MSINAIGSGTMSSQMFQSAHKVAGQAGPVKSTGQATATAQSREETNESASKRALEAGLHQNTAPQHGSINLFA